MKAGPIIAMVALVIVGMWLVLQPALDRGNYDLMIQVGSEQLLVSRTPATSGDTDTVIYEFLAPPELAKRGPMSVRVYEGIISERLGVWEAKPGYERAMLGFFNISNWFNFGWVAVGLLGQGAFFGRMFVQWIVSEKSGESQVPEIFWWFSFFGGLFLFTYFVWRVDVVGVLGQSTGVVIYARNLRLIYKQRKRTGQDSGPDSGPREQKIASASPEPGEAKGPSEPT